MLEVLERPLLFLGRLPLTQVAEAGLDGLEVVDQVALAVVARGQTTMKLFLTLEPQIQVAVGVAEVDTTMGRLKAPVAQAVQVS